jgi:hypothetical protein
VPVSFAGATALETPDVCGGQSATRNGLWPAISWSMVGWKTPFWDVVKMRRRIPTPARVATFVMSAPFHSMENVHWLPVVPAVAFNGQPVDMPFARRETSLSLALHLRHAVPSTSSGPSPAGGLSTKGTQVASGVASEFGPPCVYALICPVKSGSVKVDTNRCGTRGS